MIFYCYMKNRGYTVSQLQHLCVVEMQHYSYLNLASATVLYFHKTWMTLLFYLYIFCYIYVSETLEGNKTHLKSNFVDVR